MSSDALLDLFQKREGKFNTLPDALKLLAEPADGYSGLTQAGAFLHRKSNSVPPLVRWVNVEVPAALAPGVRRERRFYPVAIRSSDQELVEDLHPWLHHEPPGPWLERRGLYALSHFMDEWQLKQLKKAHYFVIEIASKVQLEVGSPWNDWYKSGDLVIIRQCKDHYIYRHNTKTRGNLDVFCGTVKTFFVSYWPRYWLDRIGYYVGIEAVREGDPRIWAALAPGALPSTLSRIQQLCDIVHDATFRRVIDQIPECRPNYLYQKGRCWYVTFRGKTEPFLNTKGSGFPYIQRWLEQPGIPVCYSEFAKGTWQGSAARRGGDRASEDPAQETRSEDWRDRHFAEATQHDLVDHAPSDDSWVEREISAEQMIESYEERQALEELRRYDEQLSRLQSSDLAGAGTKTDTVKLKEIKDRRQAIYNKYPRIKKAYNERNPGKALSALEKTLKSKYLPKSSGHNTNEAKNKKQKSNPADTIYRRVDRQIKAAKIHWKDFGEYLDKFLCPILGGRKYIGNDVWITSPPPSSES